MSHHKVRLPAPGVNPKFDNYAQSWEQVFRNFGLTQSGLTQFTVEWYQEHIYEWAAEKGGWDVEYEPDEEAPSTAPEDNTPPPDDYFYEDPADDAFVGLFLDMRRKENVVGNLLVGGPSGCGKTEGLIRQAIKRGLPWFRMDCATVTNEEKWFGRKEIDENGTRYDLSEFLKHVEGLEYEPGLIILDEINRLHPSRSNAVFSLLDGSQGVLVQELGRYVNVHPQTIFAATANFGSAFGGTFQMDRALRERFQYTLERGFPPAKEEIKVLQSATGIKKEDAKLLVDIAKLTRERWQNNEMESPVSTRTLIAWSRLVAKGMPIDEAAKYTVQPLYRDDGGAESDRAKVKIIIAGKMPKKA